MRNMFQQQQQQHTNSIILCDEAAAACINVSEMISFRNCLYTPSMQCSFPMDPANFAYFSGMISESIAGCARENWHTCNLFGSAAETIYTKRWFQFYRISGYAIGMAVLNYAITAENHNRCISGKNNECNHQPPSNWTINGQSCLILS